MISPYIIRLRHTKSLKFFTHSVQHPIKTVPSMKKNNQIEILEPEITRTKTMKDVFKMD